MKSRSPTSPGEPAPPLEAWSRLNVFQQFEIRLLVQSHLIAARIANLYDYLLALPLPVKFGMLHSFFMFYIIALFPPSMRWHATVWDLGATWIASYSLALAMLPFVRSPGRTPNYGHAHWIGNVREL